MELREKVARELARQAAADGFWQRRLYQADAILAIPEIANALARDEARRILEQRRD